MLMLNKTIVDVDVIILMVMMMMEICECIAYKLVCLDLIASV